MASVHKVAKSPFWYAAFYLPDGRRTLRSTGTTDKRTAVKVCDEWNHASKIAKEGRLTESRARQTIADIFSIANREDLPSATLKAFLGTWLKKKSLEVTESSMVQYDCTAKTLERFFSAKADGPVDGITRRDAVAFRDDMAKRVSGGTVNKNVKIARIIWGNAVKDNVARENVFKAVDLVRAKKSHRRAFTLPEIHSILAKCGDDWRGMVMLGIYTGQRIGDLANLSWRQIDFDTGTVHFDTQKTNAILHLPMAAPLRRYLMDRPSADNPDAALFPKLAGLGTNTLSRIFSEILMEAGLIARRTHAAAKGGRSIRREVGGLCFHCLRHTATSLLKNAGVSNAIAQEIIGHESEAISRAYTHIESGTLKTAIEKMPDITRTVTSR